MKKILTILLCLFSMIAYADQVTIALLQPRVTDGSAPCKPIELRMVSGELRKALGWQSNVQVVTRMDVDQIVKEIGFQQSGMVDDAQRKQIGVMTSAQYICVSSLTKEGTQLYIEAYLVDVETGQMTNPASQYVKIENEDYGALQEPCNALAREMLGELKVGQKRSSGVVPGKGKQEVEGYVDLELPSGTLWKAKNEDCGLVSFDKAYELYGNSLPSKEQIIELRDYCLWSWTGNGYRVKGQNGKFIFLPASGWFYCDGSKHDVGSYGWYWSSTQSSEEEKAYGMYFDSASINLSCGKYCFGHAVRLVK